MRTATTHTTLVSRMLIALTLALLIGGAISQDAFAWKKQTHTTISNRTQAQKDLCDVSGGSFESTEYYGSWTNGHQLIKTKTTCTGGENPQTCTNTKDYTECTSGFVVQPKGPLDGIAVGTEGDACLHLGLERPETVVVELVLPDGTWLREVTWSSGELVVCDLPHVEVDVRLAP